jgi:Holliday junction resolvasome RuvABC endonuclease subunit
MKYHKLLAVDPSLTCSGWALFDTSNERLLGVGTIRTLGPEFPLATRLRRLQENAESVLDQARMGEGDILLCEEATSMKDPQAVAKLERVRSIFETLARSRGVRVPGRIHPRTVHYELLGLKGKQPSRDAVKAAARAVAMRLFTTSLQELQFDVSERAVRRAQDVVDALLVGQIGLSRIESARKTGTDLDDFFHALIPRRPTRQAMLEGQR